MWLQLEGTLFRKTSLVLYAGSSCGTIKRRLRKRCERDVDSDFSMVIPWWQRDKCEGGGYILVYY